MKTDAQKARKREWQRTYRAANPEKCRVATLKYRAANPEKRRETGRKQNLKKFGFTPDKYFELFQKQNGVCACCRRPSNGRLAVDHDHKTNQVRGLLCNNCNHGIGFLGDNKAGILRALHYLDEAKRQIQGVMFNGAI